MLNVLECLRLYNVIFSESLLYILYMNQQFHSLKEIIFLSIIILFILSISSQSQAINFYIYSNYFLFVFWCCKNKLRLDCCCYCWKLSSSMRLNHKIYSNLEEISFVWLFLVILKIQERKKQSFATISI